MSLLELLGISLAVIVVYMTAVWLLSLPLRNASIVDIFWGLGFIVVAAVYFGLTDGFLGRKILITALVAVWGLRLSLYILWRNWGEGEDYRYRTWREESEGRFWWTSFFRVFLLQGVVMWLVSMPVLAAQYYETPDNFTVVDFLGVLVWGIGFLFESVGDLQLAVFKSNPENKGKVLRSGLWRYTRHPNYFGDAMVWWGHFIVAAATVNGLWTVFSPVVMTFLLLRVSGVALLERKQTKTKPEYRDYVESTSAFVPWFPRSPESRL
jgi:steroid 5-alpha reductase family enzyme